MTPQVLALDAERGWMLLDDLDGVPADTLPAAERIGALEAMGEVHRAAAHLTGALLAGGCLDRRSNVLSSQIAALAEDPTVPLSDDLGERLRKVAPRLQELCDEMADAPIRPTLVHGDLHAGNLMRVADRFVVFDWSDACVADPFVDALMFLTRLPDDEALRTTCRERYLDAWPGLARAEAARYVGLAEPLAAMHHAVTYRDIHDAFGPDDWWLFEGALAPVDRARARLPGRHGLIARGRRAACKGSAPPRDQRVARRPTNGSPRRSLVRDGRARRAVMIALERLSPKQRAVFVLFYLEDRPEKEIAGLLGEEGTQIEASRSSIRTWPSFEIIAPSFESYELSCAEQTSLGAGFDVDDWTDGYDFIRKHVAATSPLSWAIRAGYPEERSFEWWITGHEGRALAASFVRPSSGSVLDAVACVDAGITLSRQSDP